MKRFLTIVLSVAILFGLYSCGKNSTEPENQPPASQDTLSLPGWELIWHDEFSGSEINAANWNHEQGGWGWGNNELQYYTNRPENSFVENGKLVIVARKENYNGNAYTSARLTTQWKFTTKYGRVEARIRLPYGQGLWPAFWMLGESISTVGWPACGEIDILEMIGGGENRDDTVYGTAHWLESASAGHQHQGGHVELPDPYYFSDAYHTFAIEWDSGEIRWFLDGQQYFSFDITPASRSEFHAPFFLILNVAVGGDWPGAPSASTVFPQRMEVDYVRVYQKSNGN